MTWFFVAVGGIVFLALASYVSFLAARYFFVARFPDEIQYGTAADGWRIAVLRYRPAEPSGRPPVLLVHGVAANRYNLDLTEEISLARHLCGRGFDVWVLELRGRGLSLRPRLFSGLRYDWSFDDYAERDLPCAADVIMRATGAAKLHLVGFSTGALAAYAWLSDPHRKVEVASLVSIGGAASFKRLGKRLSGRIIRSIRFLRHRWLMRVLAPISGYWHPSPLQIIHNPGNLDGAIQRRAMVNMIANFSRNELLQYSDWIMHDVFRSIDQRRDYRAELSRILVPALFLAGPRDALAPPDAVKETYDAVGSRDKKFVLLSRAQGQRVNYGHFDLVIGREAPAEVFPVISGWLESVQPGTDGKEHPEQQREHHEPNGDGGQDRDGQGGEDVAGGLVLRRAHQDG
ncbi:MAG: Polyhydroxyalkanoic acid synthase [Myxococcales bacterium]|nr:Polyhydroxyalkanoic acid synthase [Myxococcales bacterium]